MNTHITAKKDDTLSTTRLGWVILFLIMLLGLLLRGYRLGELPGGFLVFNEIFYVNTTVKQLQSGLAGWVPAHGSYNGHYGLAASKHTIPPLYTSLVGLASLLQLPIVACARVVSVLSGSITLFTTFLCARHLYDQRTALAAAAALAVMPGVVLVDHNIQVDSLFVALLMGSMYFYIVSTKAGGRTPAAISGILLGLSILTKQPAVLLVLVLILWETWRGCIAQLKARRFLIFLGLSTLVGLSWYLLQLMTAPARFFSGLQATGGRAGMSEKGLTFWTHGLALELAWMVFPVAAVIIVAGLLVQVKARTDGDKLAICYVTVFLLYYVQFHFHSYYLLPLAPFLAIAFGRACIGAFADRWPATLVRSIVVSIMISLMLIGSIVTLAGHKWGRWSPLSIGAEGGVTKGKSTLFVDPPALDFLGPFTELLDPRLKAAPLDIGYYIGTAPGTGDNSVILTSAPEKDYPIQIPPVHVFEDKRCRLVLFGYAVGQWHMIPQQTQMFRNADWDIEKVGPLWKFGYIEDSLPNKWTLYDRKTLRDVFMKQ